MRATAAYADLRRFGRPVITTEDAALRLRATRSAASRTLSRLAAEGLVLPLRRGLWSLDPRLDPLVLPESLTAPFPAYVSFQSALFLRGVVSQIPQVIYVASLAPPRRVVTSLGTYSIHRVAPEIFGGAEALGPSGAQVATQEKALVDVLYLANARSGLFSRLPELDLPARFDEREARRWIARIRAPYRRTMVSARLDAVLGASRR